MHRPGNKNAGASYFREMRRIMRTCSGFNLRRLAVLIIPVLMCAGTGIAGRGDKAGTAAATELLIPVGAWQIGIGGAGVAGATGVDAIYWNPGGLARASMGSMVMVSHMTYLADINVEYAAAATRLMGLGEIGLSFKTLSFGDIPVTTEDQPDGTGETTSPTYVVVGGSFARNISDRISLGFTANIIYEKMANVSASGVSFNVGVQYVGLGGIDGLQFGVVLKNIGPNMRYDGSGLLRTGVINDVLRPGSPVKIEAASNELPSSIDIGLAYTQPLGDDANIRVATAFINNNYSEDEYRVGGEYSYRNTVTFRGGYSFASDLLGREYIYGSTFGIGFHSKMYDLAISVDYAYRAVAYFSGNHVLTLELGF